MSEITTNLDYGKLSTFVRDLDRHDSEIDHLKGEHMTRMSAVRERIGNVYDLIRKAGFDLAAVKFNRREEKLEEAVKKHRANAEADTVETAELILAQLGAYADTPLGRAALSAAPEATKPPLRGRLATKATLNLSAANKAAALNVGDDEPDLRSASQKLRAREREVAGQLTGLKNYEPPEPTNEA